MDKIFNLYLVVKALDRKQFLASPLKQAVNSEFCDEMGLKSFFSINHPSSS
jgi:hypothetical protein